MSSACVCHLKEWCFYCEKYVPLEKELDELKQEIEKLISPNVDYLKYEKGQIDMSLSGQHAMNIMEAFVDLFEQNGGKNFLTMTLERKKSNDRYSIVINNLNGEFSAAEKLTAMEKERDELQKRVEDYADAVDSLYQIIQRGDLTTLDLEQTDDVVNRFKETHNEAPK